MRRKLTAAERERIARARPWFGHGRRVANDDLVSDEAEVIPFTIRRWWDVNECGPPCCPRALIVQTLDDRFIHLESCSLLPTADAIGRSCVAHRASTSKMLVAFETTGEVVAAERESVRDMLVELHAPECEWINAADLPLEFRRIAGIA